MVQSPELTAFYKAYLAWVDDGCKHSEVFSTYLGLCTSLNKYLYKQINSYFLRKCVSSEMSNQFKAAGLSRDYPFNNGSPFEYDKEKEDKQRNPRRIKWVRDHAKL